MLRIIRKKLSAILIVSLLITSISPATVAKATNMDLDLNFVDELEIDDSLIDDGMFYIPHSSIEVNEGEEGSAKKYIFKVMRKGVAEKSEKVKLTMVDISGKYDKDYKIEIIDKAIFSENVQNTFVSKSIEEYVINSDYEEYNFSDAIVDGSITPDDILPAGETESEDENINQDEEEKQTEEIESNETIEEKNVSVETEKINNNNFDEDNTEDETKKTSEDKKDDVGDNQIETTTAAEETKKEEVTINGFTDTYDENNESKDTDIDEKKENKTEDKTENDIQNETESDLKNETETESESESESSKNLQNEIETNNETEIETETKNKTETEAAEETKIETESETVNESESEIESKIETDIETKPTKASLSEVVYGSEEVEFDIKKATMSIIEGYELVTGAKSDRKKVFINRDADFLGLNKNSLEDNAYMKEGVEVVQDELKSAYVILEFDAGQTEKLIELTILDDKKYKGDRQVGFNLSSVDNSQIAGMYSSVTLIIHDDEEKEPSYINFTKNNYEPQGGYVTVEIERTGELSSLATCMLDTEDITAVSGRDYSKVHAQVIFGMGINKRTVKIPISSYYIDNVSTFRLLLQEAKGALIGERQSTICSIKKSDKSFVIPTKKSKTDSKNNIQTFGLSEEEQQEIKNRGISYTDVRDGEDYDLDSIILGNKMNFQARVKEFYSENANENSYCHYFDNGDGMELYLENHSFDGETAMYRWEFTCSNQYSANGIQLEWSVDTENAHIILQEFMRDSGQYVDFYNKNREKWDTKTTTFMLNNTSLDRLLFTLKRYDGMWRTSPTLRLNSITTILKMYRLNLIGADIPELIGDDGHKTKNHKYQKYAVTSIDGCKTDHTAIGWAGKTITVKLDNSIDNPFYIINLYITNSDGSKKQLIATNDDINTTTISFEMSEDFVYNNLDFISTIDRPAGGKCGEFYIMPELGTKPITIDIDKDDRVDINIWHSTPASSTSEKNIYNFTIGDVLHFFATVKPEYSGEYKCDGLNVYDIVPYSPDWTTIRRPTDESDYFPLDATITEIEIKPELTRDENVVKVLVDKTNFDKFDKTYGLFDKYEKHDEDKYYAYYIEDDATKITGRYFDIKARCTDETYIPIWYEVNKEKVKYAQEEYYFLGSESIDDNVIYLTCDTTADKRYSLICTAYYEDVPIGGKTTDKYWQAATNIGILVDETHFAYSDDKGQFATLPCRAKAGYYIKFKVVSNGADKYVDVQLNNDTSTERTYTIYYEDGTSQTITEVVYEVNPEDILISNVTKDHPHVDGVTVSNIKKTTFDAVYINDEATILTAGVTNRQPDGTPFQYTYVDEYGVEHTEDENTKRVEFVVVDKSSHNIKTVIEATQSNADKTEWYAYHTFERKNYALYMSGDLLYVRIVTDKKIGDGKGTDIGGGGDRKDIPVFNETTYQAVYTSYPFIEQSEQQPYIVDFQFPADKEHPIELPIIGNLATMINALGMSFGIAADADRVRLFIGKKFNGGGNRYDGNGKTVSDTAYDVGLSNFKNAFSDMTDFIKSSGTKKLGTMTLGIPTWTFEPIIGVYFEFMLYHDPSQVISDQYLFTGGGGYFGGVLELRYTFYFLVFGIPFYVGGEVDLSLVSEFGVSVDENVKIYLSEASQDFFDDMFTKTHFEYLVRSILVGSAYVGAGVAGTIGVRGGFQLTLTFIYNPFVKKKYPDVRPVGFSATGAIKLWADAVLLSIPIPIYQWPEPFNLGYFYDVEDIFPDGSHTEYDDDYDPTLEPKPRFGENSVFVANDNTDDNLFGGTYEIDSTKPLIKNVYDSSEPQIMKYDDNKALLIYLDDDHNRSDYDRTVLKYMLYDGDNVGAEWSEPQNVWEGNTTADFYPNLCDCGDKILISFASRPYEVNDNATPKELLENMEIWTVYFDKSTGEIKTDTFERMTTDDSFDYMPKAVYDKSTDTVYLYYLKKSDITNINTTKELLKNIQTGANGSYLMYMMNSDSGDGQGKRWLRDFYYDYELPQDESKRAEFINTWKGQRFKDLSIRIGGTTPNVDDPNITDFSSAYTNIFDTSGLEMEIDSIRQSVKTLDSPVAGQPNIEDFKNNYQDRDKSYNLLAYVVDADGNISKPEDTDIYLKIRCATESEAKTIRITHNSVPDTDPKLIQNKDKMYLFWIENQSLIRMIELNDLILKSTDEDHATNGVKASNINIVTVDKLIMSDKISNIKPFVDEKNNLYVAWQQNSEKTTLENVSEEIDFKQDLYVAALVESNDEGTRVKSWSNPVRFSNNSKVNDLPTVVDIDDKLILINNQYNLRSDDKTYVVTNSNLQQTIYKPASSIEMISVEPKVCEKYDDGSKKYQLIINTQNTGLFAARGIDYNGRVTFDGEERTTFSGVDNSIVLPGNGLTIGDKSNQIYFTLTKEQQHRIDKVNVEFTAIEQNVADSGKSSERNVFDITKNYSFLIQKQFKSHKSVDKTLGVEQLGDSFVVTGNLTNSGNIDTIGNEKIYVIDQDNWDKPLATSDYLDLPVGQQTHFKIPIDKSILDKAPLGVKDLVLYVKNDDGEVLSDLEIATVNAYTPYSFKVNGRTDKLEVEAGKSIVLNTTFMPSLKYKTANIRYSVEDQKIAKTKNNILYGLTEGITTMYLTTAEFGGTKRIDIEVIPSTSPKPSPEPSRGDGSGGGSFGGAGPMDVINPNITTLPIIKNISATVNSKQVNWIYDPVKNDWKMNINLPAYGNVPMSNGFVVVQSEKKVIINGIESVNVVNDTYCFGADGKMLTGWVGTADGKWYFFENEKTADEGKMVVGWKKIQGAWYYFGIDGAMLTNAYTPDGHYVGPDGKWVSQ